MESKKPWQSKTVWVAFLMAGAAFVPPVQELIKSNPELFSALVGALFVGLRLITKGKISIE